MIHWQDLHHAKLSTQQLYALLQLRCAVFVVEQQCPYQDVDGDDLVGENRHILGWHNDEPVVIGRVIVSEALRGEKLGQQLMAQTLASCAQHWPHKALYLGAQAHLQSFYARFGFVPVTDIYDEDGIPHVGMAREAHQA